MAMIVAGMATMPTRGQTFVRSVASLLPQVDRLFIFLDRFEAVPKIVHPKILMLRSQDFGDLRAHGKFLGLLMCHRKTLYFGVDDDIFYPTDYVARMAAFLSDNPPETIAGVHGSIFKPELTSYLKDRFVADFENAQSNPIDVDVIGAGTVAFACEALRFDVRPWQPSNMDDLHLALLCARMGLRRKVVARQKLWLRRLATRQPDSIRAAMLRDDSRETALAREIQQIDRARPGRYPGQRESDPLVR